MHLDYTSQGRKPTTAQILKAWRSGGRPASFTVTYGETFAEFERCGFGWQDSGNGCSGVNRTAVVHALNKAGAISEAAIRTLCYGRTADRIDGYDRDDTGESPDY